jgi:hypothetical protein
VATLDWSQCPAAGFSPEQAAGAPAALAETLGEAPGVAGKEDVLRLDGTVKEEVLRLKAKIKEDILRLEAKIAATKAEIIKWMFGTIGFQTIIILGAVLALPRALVK